MRDFLLATVTFALELLLHRDLVGNILELLSLWFCLIWCSWPPTDDVDDEPSIDEFDSSFLTAISGNIISVLDDFFENLGSLELVLHFVPFGWWSHWHRIQNEYWQDRRQQCAQPSSGFTRAGDVHLGHDCSCSPGWSLVASWEKRFIWWYNCTSHLTVLRRRSFVLNQTYLGK